MLNVIVFFVDAFVIKGGCVSPKQASEMERAGGNALAFVQSEGELGLVVLSVELPAVALKIS
jgi:hypothetical protein